MRIVDSGSKTGFIGFLLNVVATERIVSNYVISGPLEYLLTLDHLNIYSHWST